MHHTYIHIFTIGLTDGGSRPSSPLRLQPNTPCFVGMAACAFSLGSTATAGDKDVCNSMLAAVGTAMEVPEQQLDAVTGLSGSGPAYVYQFIEVH